jgi:hypothetical protein
MDQTHVQRNSDLIKTRSILSMQVLQSNPIKILHQGMDSNLVVQLDENFRTCAYNKHIFQLFFHNFSQLFFLATFLSSFFDTFV